MEEKKNALKRKLYNIAYCVYIEPYNRFCMHIFRSFVFFAKSFFLWISILGFCTFSFYHCLLKADFQINALLRIFSFCVSILFIFTKTLSHAHIHSYMYFLYSQYDSNIQQTMQTILQNVWYQMKRKMKEFVSYDFLLWSKF